METIKVLITAMPVCVDCENALDAEEGANPRQEHDSLRPLCDACYRERYEDTCSWCEEHYEEPALCHFMAVFDQEAAGLPLPGFYRILHARFYAQALVGAGWVDSSAVVWLGYLPDQLEDADGYACGYFCPDCEQRALTSIWYRQCCAIAHIQPC